MLDNITKEWFSERLNQTFRITAGEEVIDTELVDCSGLGGDRIEGGREPFSIVLRSAMETALEQQTYRVAHSELGELDIFLVPIGPDKTGMRYEAVFT